MAKNAVLVPLFLATAWGSTIGERTTTCRTEGVSIIESKAMYARIPDIFAVRQTQLFAGTTRPHRPFRRGGHRHVRRVEIFRRRENPHQNTNDVLAPGVQPRSEPNVAVLGTVGTTLDYLYNRLFRALVGITSLQPSTTITPVAGKLKSFDLKSLWIACGTTAAQAASLSLPCTVAVTGTDRYARVKSTETIAFGPDQLYNSTMGLKEFDGWSEMVSVRITVVESGLPAVGVTNLFFDDLRYCARYV
ncbi:hypothetical protein M409DRAFT_60551 [Zasmidium cellare ATCC 36951]|uniref:Uncharacterized protein n=1 Tax=Zasmidium cellare ATCC 36951 TaxID=1080233 RepID=A0A6A6BYA1_ZASCE|nr:uncharacterized protein M409DRAFT_60551 [Zasmidium cellare ATCC 36951]KAF2159784.1 hypothetical protein M409DRAFT_60551 [Zasmidium cellare ATCC 36951]